MSKYQNIKDFLEPTFTVHSTHDTFYLTKKIAFECSTCSTLQSLTSASYSNKRYKVPIEDFCVYCKKEKDTKEHTDQFIKQIKETSGHLVKTVNFSSRIVVYECFTCKRHNKTFTQNLINATTPGVCISCQNDKNKLDFNLVEKIVELHNMTLLTKPEEYTNNKQLFCLLCKCGDTYRAVLSDIRRGKHCKKCKVQKFKDTCMERYGEDNVSKLPDVYEKIVKSSYSRKEFRFPESGRTITVMGYEPQALFILLGRIDPYLNIKLLEEDIITGKDIKTFRYGSDHLYFPDFLIRNTNHIIEVKSDYTLMMDKEKNVLKFNAVVRDGYIIRLMVFTKNMTLYEYICTDKESIQDIFTHYV